MKINLKDKYQAEATFCKDGKTCSGPAIKGKWSTIYDQSLKVELQNGQRFIANFRYNAKPTLSADPLSDRELKYADLHSGDYGSFDSDCG
mmetsp:Transcript_10052/g.15336  ORF Transcript_10052/g.15336 Transcript_10052/m.15336 type:complete len:90 (-) Transcript_10052:1416-1685(-)